MGYVLKKIKREIHFWGGRSGEDSSFGTWPVSRWEGGRRLCGPNLLRIFGVGKKGRAA